MLTPAKIQKKATIQIVTFFYFLKKEILFLVTVTITAHELINTSGCIDGVTYPLVKVEISNTSHPFYTGKSKLVDTAGRVDKFMSR